MSAVTRPLHILHLTAGSDAGGVSRYLMESARAMQARGHRVTIAGERGTWHQLFTDSSVPWIEAPLKGHPLALRRAVWRLRRHLDGQGVALIHTHFRKSALVGRRLARQFGVPMLFTLHLTGIPMSFGHRYLSDFGDHTHAPSEMARQWLIDQARVAAANITVIPHGIDVGRFPLADSSDRHAARRQLDIAPDAPVAAFVGRFDEPKNEGWMVDLAAAARPRLPKLMVLLVGEGPREAALREAIRRADVTSMVRVLNYREPLAIYQAADVVLLPSSLEGFSLVCAEAMSVGTPVLRTRTAGTREMIVEGVTGQSVPIDRDAFIEDSIAMLGDRPALTRMGAAAARHIRDNLRLDQQVDRTLALYRRLVG